MNRGTKSRPIPKAWKRAKCSQSGCDGLSVVKVAATGARFCADCWQKSKENPNRPIRKKVATQKKTIKRKTLTR